MLCIPAIIIGGGICFGVVCVIFLKLTAIWTITFWISASILSGAGALFFVCCFIGLYYNDLRSRFGKFADGMEEFYNEGKIVYWLESYNINHPINDIGEPPIEVSVDLPKGNLSGLQNDEMDTSHPKSLKLIDAPEEYKKN